MSALTNSFAAIPAGAIAVQATSLAAAAACYTSPITPLSMAIFGIVRASSSSLFEKLATTYVLNKPVFEYANPNRAGVAAGAAKIAMFLGSFATASAVLQSAGVPITAAQIATLYGIGLPIMFATAFAASHLWMAACGIADINKYGPFAAPDRDRIHENLTTVMSGLLLGYVPVEAQQN